MRIAYLDCFSGISGDMFLGTLIDVGVSPELLKETVEALNIEALLEISRVTRSGISATKVDVYSHGEKDLPREEYWKQRAERREPHHHGSPEQSHTHEHPHAPVELLEHNYSPPPDAHLHDHSHGRSLGEIRRIISRAPITDASRKNAIAIFEALGAAEAKIHDTDIEKVHFHEVGSVDAIVDIVCAAVGADSLHLDQIICSPLNVGGGTVNCAHGTFPVPAPATLELLKDAPIYSSGIQAELVTPTGAAIVKVLTNGFAQFPPMTVDKSGYGAGARDFDRHANVLRMTIGETSSENNVATEPIAVLEVNLDDLNPQVFGYVVERLLAEGALDVFALPVQMKKNRPGTLLTVLARPDDAAKLSQIIFSETTTLGIRRRTESREALSRQWISVRTQWGDVRLKVASANGTVSNYAPEYEDCRRIAAEHRVPLKTVMQEVMRNAPSSYSKE
jgi:uncharacterized protein (TIGR00299 family) protein